jgi:uncharacterized repeat protein (TIGR01451 family)
VPAVTARLQSVGQLDASKQLNLAIGLPLRNQAELKAFLEDVYNPSSPNYRHFLTTAQFTERFGPTPEDYQAVLEFAKANNLTFTPVPNRMLVNVRGAVADLEKALHVSFNVYHHPTESRDFFAPNVEPSLDLSVPVVHIGGLDNYVLPHPKSLKKGLNPPGPQPRFGSGPGGTYLGYDFRHAYLPGVTLDGSGQIVGLLQFDGYFPNDIALYEAAAGLPKVPLINVLLDGFDGTPGFGNGEVALDIEMVISMAPGVSAVILYEGFLQESIMNRMASDNLASQLSCSWGWGGGPNATLDQILQEIAAQGQTFFDASGDSDAFPPGAVDDPNLPNAPSDNPYMVQVGGTTLLTSGPLGSWQGEQVWNYFNDAGSSGGISAFYAIPTWQQGIDMTTNGGSTVFRNIPDVALTGDNVWSIADNGFGQYTAGTSCAAPLWAGLTALINQQAVNAGAPPVGSLNPALYAIGKSQEYRTAFHDILISNNTNSISTNAFFAVRGYDLCTGWGTPASTNLINLLVTPSPIPLPRLLILTNIVYGGNGNGIVDFNECLSMDMVITNAGRANATDVRVTVSTTTPGVVIAQPSSFFPDISTNSAATNASTFKISTAPEFICGIPIELNVQIKSDQSTVNKQLVIPTGVPGTPLRFDNPTPAFIPDVGSTNSVIVVSNVNFALSRIAVSLYITHTFDSDLVLKLISPDGTTNVLASNLGGAGHNYGLACADIYRTTFDDQATNSILGGFAPFLGTFQPEQPLSVFANKSGTNVNGAWRLLVIDDFPIDSGTLQCWSLIVTPSTCTNGGGECPGSDMAIGMVGAPEPAIVGNNLTYTIGVTNFGPSHANNVSVSQVLPSSVVFVSGSSSQGAVVHNNGVVTANLGPMSAGGTARVLVTVLPAVAGVFSSTASVSSDQPDFNLANNNVTLISHISPPTADLSVGLFAAPNSLVVGGNVTYTLSVTNNGPSSGASIMATNSYSPGLILRNATISQGSLYITNGNTVVCSFGGLGHGATATATITATAAATGTLISAARVFSTNPNQIDPNPINDVATVPVAVGPAADLALGLAAFPNPDIVTSNLTLVTSVTNFGPSSASAVVVNEALPTALTNITITVSPTNSFTLNGTNLTVNLGIMIPGARATITVAGGTIKQGYLSCTAGATATETDPNVANNFGSVNVLVALPFVNIVPAGTSMSSPPSGYIDIGQTNVIQFRLQNTGNVANTNLVATLLTNSSVTPVSGPQNYGILRPIGVPGGVPVSRPFSFIAHGGSGGTVTAVLSLKDGSNTNLPPVTFTFQLPTALSFANTNIITIPDPNNMPTFDSGPAAPYPSAITVSGVTGQIARVTATLVGLTHTYVHDVNALLVSPTGAHTLLLSHAADQSAASGATVTFDDAAASPLPAVGSITSGSWQPSAYPPSPVFSNPAPPGPYTASMATFGGANPNGTWSLYVYDDSTGDAGNITSGWSLSFDTVTPVNPIADVGLSGTASSNPALAGDVLTYTFSVTNAGPSGATGVTFSNTLPASLVLLSATTSQGNAVTNGNSVVANLASIPLGSSATVTVMARVTVAAVGLVTNTASVAAFETDLHTSDNQASVVTTINVPTAALALGITAAPTNVFIGSNLVYTIGLTNSGPGNALSVSVSDTLPGNVTFVSATAQPGSATFNSGTVVATMGDLSPNATGVVTVTVRPQAAGWLTNTAVASTLSSNGPAAGLSVVAVVNVLTPGPIIVPAGAGLVFESYSPPNGAVDPGEQVTVSLSLANTGVLDTASLVATLLATNGVTQPSAPASYGQLVHGGAAASRNFTFTASPAATGSVVATLQLTDGVNNLGTASFVFPVPGNNSFANTNSIVIPDHGPGSPYPSIINVTGLNGYVSKATVTLSGLTHSFPSDVNVLLVNPAGSSTLLMSHNGGAYSITNVTLTFDDAATTSLPDNTARITTSTNRPSRFTPSVTFPAPAPAAPYGASLSVLNNSSPNGAWSLYVLDDSAGDSGVIASGWTLNLSTVNPTSPLADLAAGMTDTPSSVLIGGTLAYSINVTNLGPSTAVNVQVADTLPEGFSLVSSLASTGSVAYTAGTVEWSAGDLAMGGTASLSLTVAPSLAGTFLNLATVSANVTDLNPANNSPQVFAQAISPLPATLSGTISNGFFVLTVNAQPGLNYMVQASTNLNAWVSLGIYTATNGTFTVRDNSSPSLRTRYYRTVRQIP